MGIYFRIVNGRRDRSSGRVADATVLTFVTPIDLGFADKGWTVDLVAAQEDVGRIGIASADIAWDKLATATIVAFMLITATEKAIPLKNTFNSTNLVNPQFHGRKAYKSAYLWKFLPF